ncbi:MAG: DNA glycosylase [Clostridia bacterium]|nr:DNA glycosylase [Clostridia bacterium]
MLITDLSDFNLIHIFECGQCFRWSKDEKGVYKAVVGDYIMTAKDTKNGVEIICDDDSFITEYFDLERDYGKVKSLFSNDEILNVATKHGYGIRLLKQQPFETVISFIISANNNIPRIKKIIESLCENFGEKIIDGSYKFPTPEVLSKLTVEDLSVIRSGFRAKYIIDASKKIASGEIDLEKIYSMDSTDGREYLKQIKGIGDKVADCILLFAYQKFDVFPKDVWIKKILHNLYNVDAKDFDLFIKDKFGKFGGFAQQYLFYYGREFI